MVQYFNNTGVLAGAGEDGASIELVADGTPTGAAFLTFHRPGLYATRFGLDENNEFTFGGWSEGAGKHRFWTTKNFNPVGPQNFYTVPNTATPAVTIHTNQDQYGLTANSYADFTAKFYWGEGLSANRVDPDGNGAIGQGRIHAPHNLIFVDRIDNGTSDGSDGQPSNGLNTVSLLHMEHTVGGGTGVRETQRINTIFDTPSKPHNVNRNYVASRRRVAALVSDSGSFDRPAGDNGFTGGSGAFFADNPEAYAGPNARNLLELAVSEANVGILNGGSARILYGYSVVKNGPGQGDVVDAAFGTGTFPGSAPFKDQFLFSDVHGGNPLDPNGTLMRVGKYNGQRMKVNTVFDFRNLEYDYLLVGPYIDIRPNVFALTNAGLQFVPGLPRNDPHSAGYWWVDGSGVVRMSLG
jgi:hypothetical protein